MLQKVENFIFNGPAIKGIHFLEQPDYTKATAFYWGLAVLEPESVFKIKQNIHMRQ